MLQTRFFSPTPIKVHGSSFGSSERYQNLFSKPYAADHYRGLKVALMQEETDNGLYRYFPDISKIYVVVCESNPHILMDNSGRRSILLEQLHVHPESSRHRG